MSFKGLESDGKWSKKPEEMVDDNLYHHLIKKLDNKCNRIAEAEYPVEIKDKAEAVRRSGRLYLKALYELNNSDDLLWEDKINPCIE